MRGTSVRLFGLLLLLLAISANGWWRYPDEASEDGGVQSHMDYLRSLGGGEKDGSIAQALARQRIRRHRRYY